MSIQVFGTRNKLLRLPYSSRLTCTTGPVYSCLPLNIYKVIAISSVPQSMTLDQFMVLATTGVVKGQVRKKISGVRKHNAATLMRRPNLPSDHLRVGSAGPRIRRWTTQLIVRKYETSTARAPREVIAFSATEDPRLISEMSEVTPMDTVTAGRGMFQLGET